MPAQNDQAAPAQADPPLEMLCDTVPGVVLLMIAPVLPLLRMVVAPAPENDAPSVPKIDAVPPTKNPLVGTVVLVRLPSLIWVGVTDASPVERHSAMA